MNYTRLYSFIMCSIFSIKHQKNLWVTCERHLHSLEFGLTAVILILLQSWCSVPTSNIIWCFEYQLSFYCKTMHIKIKRRIRDFTVFKILQSWGVKRNEISNDYLSSHKTTTELYKSLNLHLGIMKVSSLTPEVRMSWLDEHELHTSANGAISQHAVLIRQ